MGKYLRLTTNLTEVEIQSLESELLPQELKRRLASEVVSLYHGTEAGAAAVEQFDRVFVAHEMPEDVPEVTIPASCVSNGTVYVPRLLAELGMASSASDGRRLIEHGGVYVDDDRLEANDMAVDDLRGRVIRVSRRRFAKLV
jgi:tyrosyl-tRNA synthetase